MSKLKITKLGPSTDLDYQIAIEVMGFQKHQWHAGGSAPADAKIKNPGSAWGANGVGGTYPYILPTTNTIFRRDHGFGETWEPSKNISQAFEVIQKIRTKLRLTFRIQDLGTHWRAGVRGKPTEFYNDREKYHATGETAAEAICRAALKAIRRQA